MSTAIMCGSQIAICDYPVRLDTYTGCSHGCKYCFVYRKNKALDKVLPIVGSSDAILRLSRGERTTYTNAFDWKIPLHWGGMSDPFQPIESVHRASQKCLEVFIQTQYPFIFSTKGRLAWSAEYLDLIRQSKCVAQVSMACTEMDSIETAAPGFMERLRGLELLSKSTVRTIVRVQPYIPNYFKSILKNIKLFRDAGAYGVVVEAIKFFDKQPGTVKFFGDNVYPLSVLKPHFFSIKEECHRNGLKFFSGENRLRSMGDSLTCCGCGDLEVFRPNKCNLNYAKLSPQDFVATTAQREPGSGYVYKALTQKTPANQQSKKMSLLESVELAMRTNMKEMIE